MIDDEFIQVDKKEYYEYNKKKFLEIVEQYNKEDDMFLFAHMFHLMIRMMRVSGMSFENIERFFQLENRSNLSQIFQFTKLLTLYKKSDENEIKNRIAKKYGKI